jgi:hypothetical protein
MSFNITSSKNKIRNIKAGDTNWIVTDGIVQYPRAVLKLSRSCPYHIVQQIAWAMDNGFLSAEAYTTEREIIISGLTK